MPEKRPALGRGLSALIPDTAPVPQSESETHPSEVDLDLLQPNAEQPRTDMDEARLDELARSIKASGVIQPILVRPVSGGGYEIVAGERRWRAAQKAGLLRVPVNIRNVPADKRLEIALVENIQRENLNPIEEARAYRKLTDQFDRTQEEIAQAVGKDRSTIANTQRLLTLPSEVQAEVAGGRLSVGHAKTLIGLPDSATQRRLARDVRSRDLSVRETEALVKKMLAPKPMTDPKAEKDVHIRTAEEQLRLKFGTRVNIVRSRHGGRIEIQFASEEELQRLYEELSRGEDSS